MAVQRQPYISIEDYLEQERASETKHEYYGGEIFDMAGGSLTHAQIALNLHAQLAPFVRKRGCRGFSSDARVQVEDAGLFTYPDLSYVCGEPKTSAWDANTLVNATIIVEVLSPATEAYDRGAKFSLYRRMESLTDYILVSQDRMRVEHFTRDGERWILEEADGAEAEMDLPVLGCSVPLREIYDGVEIRRDSL